MKALEETVGRQNVKKFRKQSAAPDGYLSSADAAKLLGIVPQTLAEWRWRKRPNLPYIKYGKIVCYSKQDIENFIAAHKVEVK